METWHHVYLGIDPILSDYGWDQTYFNLLQKALIIHIFSQIILLQGSFHTFVDSYFNKEVKKAEECKA
jgi:hypothetical protein